MYCSTIDHFFQMKLQLHVISTESTEKKSEVIQKAGKNMIAIILNLTHCGREYLWLLNMGNKDLGTCSLCKKFNLAVGANQWEKYAD